MGLGYKEVTKLVEESFVEYIGKENVEFCELGNNYLKGEKLLNWLKEHNYYNTPGGQQHAHGVVSKRFWESVGFNHTSIDMNALDGSLYIDLRKQVPDSLVGKFDIVYDGGTGEHVDNQYFLFKNCHDMVKEGGTIVHILPKVGNFPGHCSYYYTVDTFVELGKLNGYDVKEVYEHNADGGTMIYSLSHKVNNNQFISKQDFKTVPITFTNTNTRDRVLYSYAYSK